MNTEVWQNFSHAMAEKGLLKKEAKASDPKLYNLNKDNAGEETIKAAHPGGGPTVAQSDSKEGGKVETQVEQQEKDIAAALSVPTGNIVAEVVIELTKMANEFEEKGNFKAATIVDQKAQELASLIEDVSDLGTAPVITPAPEAK